MLASRADTTTGSFGTAFVYTLTVCFNGTDISGSCGNAAVAAETTEIPGGVFAGIGGDTGSPKFTAYTIDKHLSTTTPAEPSCPTCATVCGCLSHLLPATSLVVDLGAGGWTNDECNQCEGFQGEYVLGDILDNFCGATFSKATTCPDPCYATPRYMYRQVAVVLEQNITTQLLRWRVNVSLTNILNTDPSCPDYGASVTYYGDYFDAGGCATFPRTLTKSGTDSDRFGLSKPCDGALPSTITLDAA